MRKSFFYLGCFLLTFALVLPSCKKTEGCNDPFANNAGEFDTDCDNCCTYDADNFFATYLGDLRFESFSALDADSVTFQISPGLSTPDSVLIQITTEDAIIPAQARVDGDSIFILALAEDFELPLFQDPTDILIEGSGKLDSTTDSLHALLVLTAIELNGFGDQFTFKGKKQ